jgi:hypothetical protein
MAPSMKGKFPVPSQAMADHLAEHVSRFDCEKRKMFGHPCYFIHGNMFAGVFAESIFARFSVEDRGILDSERSGVLFEPVKGRSMKEYRVLTPGILEDPVRFDVWLGRSYDYTSTLPPKL